MVRELDLRLFATPALQLANIGLGDLSGLSDTQRAIVQRLASVPDRRTRAARGEALSDGSYPIPDVPHLKMAVQAYGLASNKSKVRGHITRRARSLDRTDLLPESWGVRPNSLVAAGPDGAHDGIMVAIYPPPDIAQSLAGGDSGDLPPEEMHVTLAYLGTVDEFTPEDIAAMQAAVANVAQNHQPFQAKVQGTGTFEAPDGDNPHWYAVDAEGLAALRTDVVSALEQAGCQPRTEHDFTPHMTIRYGGNPPAGVPDGANAPWSVDHLALVTGDERHNHPLGVLDQSSANTAEPTKPLNGLSVLELEIHELTDHLGDAMEFAWNPDIHPADKHGRPLAKGVPVKHPTGEGKVVGNAPARGKPVVQVSGGAGGPISVPATDTEVTAPEDPKALDDHSLKQRHAAISQHIGEHLDNAAQDQKALAADPTAAPKHPEAVDEAQRLVEKRKPYAEEITSRMEAGQPGGPDDPQKDTTGTSNTAKTAGKGAPNGGIAASAVVASAAEWDPNQFTYFWNPETSETFRVDQDGNISVFASMTDEQEAPTWQAVDTANGPGADEVSGLPKVSDPETLEAIIGAALTGVSADVVQKDATAVLADAAVAAPAPEAPENIADAQVPEEPQGRRFRIPVLIPEGVPTGDRRLFAKGALEAKECPMPLLWQRETDEGHKKSVIVGRIDKIESLEGGGLGNAEGVFDTSDDAKEAQRLVGEKMQTGVSGDIDNFQHELSQDADGNENMLIKHGRLVAATIVAKPAFQEASIELIPEEGDEPVIVASAGPLNPPMKWFFDPKLERPTMLTVTDEGRVFGHIAEWGAKHLGNPKLSPPRSASGYRYFNRRPLRTAEGEDVRVGQLTLIGGHAELSMDPDRVVKHYDDTRSAVADVVAGEDEFGIWVAGAMRPDVTPNQIRAFRASEPSGDWRMRDGKLELVACCQVNVPGFGVNEPRALVASAGDVVALVAAGMVGHSEKKATLEEKVATLSSQVETLLEERESARRAALLEQVKSLA